jgi:hypothetical protein
MKVWFWLVARRGGELGLGDVRDSDWQLLMLDLGDVRLPSGV